jgi:hypothetical protein
LGYFGNYGFALSSTLSAIVYLLIFAKEPLIKNSSNPSKNESQTAIERNRKSEIEILKQILMVAFVKPLQAMSRLFSEPRSKVTKVKIVLLLVCYAIYSLSFQVKITLMYY